MPLLTCFEFEKPEDFLGSLMPFGPQFLHYPRTQWVFRGQANADWGLLPSALRPSVRSKLVDCAVASQIGDFEENDQFMLEAWAVHQFVAQSNRAGLPLPEYSLLTAERLQSFTYVDDSPMSQKHFWIPSDLFSIVAIAQHHGVPTRLLDWSYSPLVAAYFSAASSMAEKTRPERFSVFALLVDAKNGPCKELLTTMRERRLFPDLINVPRAGNPNLHAQQGLFTHSRVSDLFTQVGQAPNPVPGSQWLFKFTLPGQYAEEVLQHMDRLGCNAATLFPGFDGAAKAVLESTAIYRGR